MTSGQLGNPKCLFFFPLFFQGMSSVDVMWLLFLLIHVLSSSKEPTFCVAMLTVQVHNLLKMCPHEWTSSHIGEFFSEKAAAGNLQCSFSQEDR